MPFQSTVNLTQGFGVVGELFTESPKRLKSYILNSASNPIGYAYTVASEGVAVLGGTGVFAGILANPKTYALKGTTSGTLTPTLNLQQYEQGELCTMGEIIVYLNSATAAIGAGVYYDNTTGALYAGTASAGQTQIPNCKVSRYALTAAGLAVIELTN